MDIIRNFPMITVILSLFSGSLCFVLKGRTARYYTIFYEVFLLIVCSAILWYTVTTGMAVTYPMGEFPAPWGNELRAGILEALLAVLFMVIMIVSVLAGYRYIDTDMDESKVNLYYAILNLMTASLMAILWTNDLFSGYVFLEILTLTSCGSLIVREIGRTTLAAVRYMILNLLGSGLFLLGVVLLYDLTGHLLMVPMQESSDGSHAGNHRRDGTGSQDVYGIDTQYRSPDDRTFHQVRSLSLPFLDAGFLQLVNAYFGQYSLFSGIQSLYPASDQDLLPGDRPGCL